MTKTTPYRNLLFPPPSLTPFLTLHYSFQKNCIGMYKVNVPSSKRKEACRERGGRVRGLCRFRPFFSLPLFWPLAFLEGKRLLFWRTFFYVPKKRESLRVKNFACIAGLLMKDNEIGRRNGLDEAFVLVREGYYSYVGVEGSSFSRYRVIG